MRFFIFIYCKNKNEKKMKKIFYNKNVKRI